MSSPIAKASVFVCGDVTAAAKTVTALGEVLRVQTITIINQDTTEIEGMVILGTDLPKRFFHT